MGPESGPKNWSPFLGFNRNPIKTKFKVPKMGPFLGPVFGTIFGPIFGIFVFFGPFKDPFVWPSQHARSQAKGVCSACCIRIRAFPFVVLVSVCYASPCWSHGIVGDALRVTALCALLTNRGGHLQSSAWQVLMPL